MSKKTIVKIAPDGKTLSGLHSDILHGLGEMHIQRASHVEFCDAIGKWVVSPCIGPYADTCLLQTFDRRKDAIDAEVTLLSAQHEQCLI